MDPNIIGVVSAVALLLAIILFFTFRKKNREKGEAQSEYIAALNYMIEGDQEKALEKLRNTVRINTDFIDAYIKIGDIFRQMNVPDNAVKVHKDLLVRQNLKAQERTSILKALARDFHKQQKYSQALDACEQLLRLDKNNTWVQDFEVKIYEDKRDWQQAFDLVKKNNRMTKDDLAGKLSFYKVQLGKEMSEQGRAHDGRLRFREAIKLNPKNVSPYLELADSYIHEKRDKDALAVLEKFIFTNPQSSAIAFARLKQVLFELGHFGDIERIYNELSKKNPEVIEGHLGLAEIYEKKGELHKAVDAANRALTFDPNRLDAKLLLLKLNSKLGRDEVASQIISDLANELLEKNQKNKL